MDQKQIDRINELARKAKTPEGLTEWERMEHAALRREYALKQLPKAQKELLCRAWSAAGGPFAGA